MPAAACRAAGVALLGGETAEMPGVYQTGELDLVGTVVGLVDRAKLIDGSRIAAGDAILGLASSGLHTNGFSLARLGEGDAARRRAGKLDLRTYGIGAQILKDLGVRRMRLLSHPRKMPSMAGYDLEIVGFEPGE